jgi:prepilin-type processing-associated H-X9-DG protein
MEVKAALFAETGKPNMKNISVTQWTLDEREHNARIHRQSSVAHGAAFTLIELLVIVANLAILAVILLPVLQSAIIRGKEIQCRNNLKQLGTAELLYLNNNSGNMFPYQGSTWITPLEPVYSAVTNMICPLTTIQTPSPGSDTAGTYNLAWIKYINTGTTVSSDNGSYTFNGYLYATVLYGDAVPFYKDSNVKYPARTPVFGDGVWVDCWPSTNDIIPNPLNLQAPYVAGEAITGIPRLLMARHGPNWVNPPPTALSEGRTINLPGGINMIFMDGHVEDEPLINLWNLYWHPNWVTLPPK